MAKSRRRSCCGCGHVQTIVACVLLVTFLALAGNLYILKSPLPPPGGPAGEQPADVPPEAPRVVDSPEPNPPPAKVSSAEEVEPRADGEARPEAASEDNAPRPAMRPSDSQFDAAPGLTVVPGAGPGRWHGLLGLGKDGSPLVKPTPLPPNSNSNEFKWEAHMGQCYNARKSDALPLDREQPDTRPEICKLRHRAYKKGLPRASVVIVFHNEIASALLRSVHSVLNQSPPELLLEVILVDDASVPAEGRFPKERWDRLQGPLVDYIQKLPKVRLVRLGERRGLMLARMEGAWRAGAEVVIFLDSHIEASPGWIEPLLARIQEDRRHVVVPNILGIHFDNFNYQGTSGLGVLSFTWTLGQRPLPTASDGSEIRKSPIMAGGLFAADKAFFMKLGGYDPEMKFYGGEEMEIGFRTWQCGGDIEFVPCSRVYHIFRTSTYWQGKDSAGVAYKVPGFEITRNKLRAAAVWMDEFEALVRYASPPLPPDVTLGDLEPRIELRRRLQCKPFRWYLKTVAQDIYVPKIEGLRAGSLRNLFLNACFDTLGGDRPGLYPCHGQHGTQGLVIDGSGMIRIPLSMYARCLSRSEKDTVRLEPCSDGDPKGRQHWTLSGGRLQLRGSDECLQAAGKVGDSIPYAMNIGPCHNNPEQKWEWQEW